MAKHDNFVLRGFYDEFFASNEAQISRNQKQELSKSLIVIYFDNVCPYEEERQGLDYRHGLIIVVWSITDRIDLCSVQKHHVRRNVSQGWQNIFQNAIYPSQFSSIGMFSEEGSI